MDDKDSSSPSLSPAANRHPDLSPPSAATRNNVFEPDREPFQAEPGLQLRQSRATGPFSSLNPTSAHYRLGQQHAKAAQAQISDEKSLPVAGTGTAGVNYRWTSRNNRKGRHALAVDPRATTRNNNVPPRSSSAPAILRGVARMFTCYPVWDVSYLVAVVFTIGSVVWIFNAFFVFLPLVRPSTEFGTEILYGGGITAFIGATIFEFGSFLLMAEAINENRTGCFGWAVEQLEEQLRLRPSDSACTHHHINKHNLVGSGKSDDKNWIWWPGWNQIRSHYLHEVGFLACLSQLFGATVFWISGLTALPGIYNHMSPGLTDGIYWTPQVIGGSGFVVSGLLFMIETQRKWYIPAPKVLGWHIGAWNFIGGLGFLLCPCFGYDTSSWAQYQASCSTFWGSWAFLIGSVIQWYESLDKHPVEHEDLGELGTPV